MNIFRALEQILVNQENMMATLADIQAAVAAEQTVEQSAITLLQTLSADLKAALAANDPAAVQAVVDTIDQNAAALAAAVTANTPAPTGTTASTGTVASTGTIASP